MEMGRWDGTFLILGEELEASAVATTTRDLNLPPVDGKSKWKKVNPRMHSMGILLYRACRLDKSMSWTILISL
jgi:hypothetical protein